MFVASSRRQLARDDDSGDHAAWIKPSKIKRLEKMLRLERTR